MPSELQDIFAAVRNGVINPSDALKLIDGFERAQGVEIGPAQSVLLYSPQWRTTGKVVAPKVEVSIGQGLALFEADPGRFVRLAAAAARVPGGVIGRTVRVAPGSSYARLGNDEFQVRPGEEEDFRRLVQAWDGDGFAPGILWHAWDRAGAIAADTGLISLFVLSKAMLASKGAAKPAKLLYLYGLQGERSAAFGSSVTGLGRTLRRENPLLDIRAIRWELDSEGISADEEARLLLAECRTLEPEALETCLHPGGRRIRVLEPLEPESASAYSTPSRIAPPLRKGGTYLITGGAGGLGLIFARHLAETCGANLLLTGRSALAGDRLADVEALGSLGGRASYLSADMSLAADARRAVAVCKERYGRLDGIFHCAGVIEDELVLRKEKASFERVLAPKLLGTLNLDVATAGEPLDLFVLFSSIGAFAGNPGQADYASANAFLDGFADLREADRAAGTRKGLTLSLGWPQWREGGMRISPEKEAFLSEAFGLGLLGRQEGLEAFGRALRSQRTHVAILAGDAPRIRALLAGTAAGAAPGSTPALQAEKPAGDPRIAAQAEKFLKKIISGVIKLPVDRIGSNDPFEGFGIDSIRVMKITSQLEQDLGELSKTLFFEYQTVKALAAHLLEAHGPAFRAALGEGKEERPRAESTGPAPLPAPPSVSGSVEETPSRPEPAAVPQSAAPKESGSRRDDAEIAIIGVAGRYPKARNLGEYWENLAMGRDCIEEIPPDRWDHAAYFDPSMQRRGSTYGKWGGFLEGVDRFDPLFFNIAPRDAAMMDPQERLFLETAWSALEDAGYTRTRLAAAESGGDGAGVGVFVGVMWGAYQLFGIEEFRKGNPTFPGSPYWSIANRLSFFLDAHGPSMAVDSACSSSLTAIHLACESLRNGESSLAIAGGINLSLHPSKYVGLGQSRFLSTDGRCRSFGEGGDGYVPGEGVGAVLLKPLAQAVADGDRIHAVIKGSAINHGGRTNGFTVPNPVAQGKVIRKALRRSGVHPRTLSYVEAHGTGTALGDPIEIAGLNRAIRGETTDRGFCALGSVKSNIGHLEAAAGIAAVTKVLLQMRHRTLAASLHAEPQNPNLNLAESPFIIPTRTVPWEKPEVELDGIRKVYPRRAAVSSFGAGGSNAHLVLEEFEDALPRPESGSRRLFVLSARTSDRLKVHAAALRDHVTRSVSREEGSAGEVLGDISHTLRVGREAMEERLAIVAARSQDLADALEAYLSDAGPEKPLPEGCALFTGSSRAKEGATSIFDGDEDDSDFIRRLARKDKLEKIAGMWVSGVNVDWAGLKEEGSSFAIGRITSLPTYPFTPDRHWIRIAPEPSGLPAPVTPEVPPLSASTPPVSLSSGAPFPAAAQASSPDAGEAVFLVKDWNTGERPSGPRREWSGTFLLLSGREDHAIRNELSQRAAGARWILWRRAAAYARPSRTEFEFDFADESQGRRAAEECLRDFPEIDGLVDASDAYIPGGLTAAIEYGKLPVLQGLARRNPALRVIHITRGLQLFKCDQPRIEGAWMASLVKVLGSEHRRAVFRTVDIDSRAESAALADLLALEMDPALPGSEVCYRDGRRHLPVFRHLSAPPEGTSPSPSARPGPRLDAGKVYVVTGGTRGIGAEIARHLADKGARKLVLMGMEPLPPRTEWPVVLAGGAADAPSAGRIRHVLDLEAKGVVVETYAGSLMEASALESYFSEARNRLGPIGGVVHAGMRAFNDTPFFADKSLEDIRSVLEPKIEGALVLERIFARDELEFLVLFTSVAGVIPSRGAGNSHYASANGYLDFLASHRFRSGKEYFRSIAWVYWGETGSATGEELRARLAGVGIHPSTTKEGLAAFDQALSLRQPAVLAGRLGPRLLSEAGVDGTSLTVELPGEGKSMVEEVVRRLAWFKNEQVATYDGDAQGLANLSRYSALRLLGAFRDRNVLPRAGESVTRTRLQEALDVVPKHGRLLNALVDLLAREGYLATEGEIIIAPASLDHPDTKQRLAEIHDFGESIGRDHPDLRAHLRLLDACVARLPEVLAGTVAATDVIFPGSSLELVKGVYKGNRISDYFNQCLSNCIRILVQLRIAEGGGGRIRILEVGSGTGGTSAPVLEALAPFGDHLEYHYTDLSAGFLQHGRKTFGSRYPFLSTAILDIGRDVASQGLALGAFDVVFGANVFHATPDVRRSLGEAAKLLKSGGLFLLNEVTAVQNFTTLTFGLLDGWWLSEDGEARLSHSPLVDAPGWMRMLEESGFAKVHAFGEPYHRKPEEFHQSVILCESRGLPRYPRAGAPHASKGRVTDQPAGPPASGSPPHRNPEPHPGKLQKIMSVIFAEELGIPVDRIRGDVAFGEYGMDSILMGGIVRRIESELKIQMNPALLLEHPTLSGLAIRLAGDLPAVPLPIMGGTESIAPSLPGAPTGPDSPAVAPRPLPGQGPVSVNRSELKDAWLAALTALFNEELGLAPGALRHETPFGDYGVDSILMAALIRRMEVLSGGSLNPGLLLEFGTLESLAGHFSAGERPPLAAPPAPVVLPASASGDARPPHPGAASVPEAAAKPMAVADQGPDPRLSGRIAVIGMSCRFPGSPDKETYWRNLAEGRDLITEVPRDRFDIHRIYASDAATGKSTSKWGGFLEGIENFDAGYFKFKPEEALHLDPLIRLFLEECAQALQDSGYGNRGLAGRAVGVFAGTRASSYARRVVRPHKNTLVGVAQNFISAHASQFFDFRGPNLVVDTACSSSLVSIHLAAQSLLSGECEVALAGGVDLILDPSTYLILSEMKALSPSGRCRSFDEGANGFVPGEGCGVVVLKPLEKALADGDPIHAVLAASAVNNDGYTMGITTPSMEAQESLVSAVLRKGAIHPETITMVEAHGTATMIGDPIELKALANAYRKHTSASGYCAVGSVKSNFGHLLSAAGIASFIKCVLALERRQIPPTLHCGNPNPRFEFSKSPFFPNPSLREWEGRGGIRRAAVSSFGLGGTNCHAVIEEWVPEQYAGYRRLRHPLPSAVFERKRFWLELPENQADGASRTFQADAGFLAASSGPLPGLLELVEEDTLADRAPLLELEEETGR